MTRASMPENLDLLARCGARPWTVSELTAAIHGALAQSFAGLQVIGEISNFHVHQSGHWYFSLKDANATIAVVMFRNLNRRVRFQPQDGLEVIVSGDLAVYAPRGAYQLQAVGLEPRGAGALELAFKQLKEKLEREGLFLPQRKRPPPVFPRTVGVLTSPSGAALRDILTILRRRWPAQRIVLAPVPVQGAEAAPGIVAGLARLAAQPEMDVIIIARGGGSLEDLWAFNTEEVARAIAACPVPVIAGIGHETDWTIADLVADVRAPTPSGAAQRAVPDRQEYVQRLGQLRRRVADRFETIVAGRRARLRGFGLARLDPRRMLGQRRLRLDDLADQLQRRCAGWRQSQKNKLVRLAQRLDRLHPLSRLRFSRARLVKAGRGLEPAVSRLLQQGARERSRLDIERLRAALKAALLARRVRLEQYRGTLAAMNPLRVLDRGYALVRRLPEGTVVKSPREVAVADLLEIMLSGRTRLWARVEKPPVMEPEKE